MKVCGTAVYVNQTRNLKLKSLSVNDSFSQQTVEVVLLRLF